MELLIRASTTCLSEAAIVGDSAISNDFSMLAATDSSGTWTLFFFVIGRSELIHNTPLLLCPDCFVSWDLMKHFLNATLDPFGIKILPSNLS